MNNHRSTIVGFATLIVLLSAGAAQSLTGSNTVFTDDIADAHVRLADIGAGAVGSSEIIDNSIRSADIGNDLVTGDDVNEATLIVPPAAAAGSGIDPGATSESAHGTPLSVTMARAGNLVVMATASTMSLTCSAGTNCQLARFGLYVDGNPIPGSAARFGTITAGAQMTQDTPTLFGVVPVSAGAHEVTVRANSDSGSFSLRSSSALRILAFSG